MLRSTLRLAKQVVKGQVHTKQQSLEIQLEIHVKIQLDQVFIFLLSWYPLLLLYWHQYLLKNDEYIVKYDMDCILFLYIF